MITNPFSHALTKVNAPSGQVLWLYGEAGIASGEVYQPWHHLAESLRRQGYQVITDIEKVGRNYDAVFVNCPKQQEETEGLIALALQRSSGFVMAAARSDAGGNRLKGIFESYGLPIETLSKSHSKIVWTLQAKRAEPARIRQFLENLTPCRVEIEGEDFWSVPGLFGWNKIDPGSKLLLRHLPSDLSGRIADFGCGYGYLSVMAARLYPALQMIDAYDADARAVACCARNLENKANVFWQDIRTFETRPHYDAILMNPPFHAGKEEDLALGQIFITQAWRSLKAKGRLFMVANRGLPYEKTVPGVSILFEGEGYKILTGRVP